ncbi:MAG: (2Fe-2S) ferredoxin [Pseudohongiellaceae bacterium]|jgi:(2Fe-2S) ferredoxin
MRFSKHIFICTNARGDDDERGSCAALGGGDVAKAIKIAAYNKGLKGKVRVNKAGCLDACADGVSLVVYPDGVWYAGVTLGDVEEIVEETLVKGLIVERLVSQRHPRQELS